MKLESVRAKRRRKKAGGGLALIVGVACLALALLGSYSWVSRQRPDVDQTTLCPSSGPLGLEVILVDRTDLLTIVQRQALKNRFDQLKDRLPAGWAVEVYSVGPIQDHLLQAEGRRVCNPGNPERTNSFTGNRRIQKRIWREHFSQPLDSLLASMLRPMSSPISPILESIQSVGVTAFEPLSEAAGRRLIIVSDMLQNTAEFSQYHEIVPFARFRESPYYRRVRANLARTDVEILYLRRDEGLQGTKHLEFWQQYFMDTGARLVGVSALEG